MSRPIPERSATSDDSGLDALGSDTPGSDALGSDTPGLVVQGVSLQMGRSPRNQLQDISFELKPGEITALLGGTGSGKTLLLKLLVGLKTASRGQILWRGREVSRFAPVELRRQVVWVPQQPRLLGMAVGEAIAYPLRLQGQSNTEIQRRMEVWLEILGLPPDWLALPSQALPPDAAQGIALARALVMEPRLLLLDNPWLNSLPSLQQKAAWQATTEASWAESTVQNLSHWDLPQNGIARALTQLSQRGGIVLWAGKTRVAMAQRLLTLEQGQLQGDRPANPATWEQVISSLALNARGETHPLDSSTEADWD